MKNSVVFMIKAQKLRLRMKITATKKGTWPLPNDPSADVHRVSGNIRIKRAKHRSPSTPSSKHPGCLADGLTLKLLLKEAEWKLLIY